MDHIFIPITNFSDTLELFSKVLNNILSSKREQEFLKHSEWASIIFKNGDSIHQSYLSKITNNFKDYMIYGKVLSYKFNFELINEHFPGFFTKQKSKPEIISEIQLALKAEIWASKKQKKGRIIYFEFVEDLGAHEAYFLFSLKALIDNDESVRIIEGMQVTVAVDKYRFPYVTILDYNVKESKIYIRSNTNISTNLKYGKKKRLYIDSTWLIDKVSNALDDFDANKMPIGKILLPKWEPSKLNEPVTFYKGQLDEFQQDATSHSLTQDITAIWGPPGTGKSTTLGYLLLELFRRKEKTLVCSIANVAVDTILKSTLKAFTEFEKNGNNLNFRNNTLLRIGYSSDTDINDKKYLKIDSDNYRELSRKLKEILIKIDDAKLNEEGKIKLISDRRDLIDYIEKEKSRIISNSILNFSTSLMGIMEKTLSTMDFDNLIIDEASMMSPPHLLALAKNVNKRIIIAGDFRQLGPVVVSHSEMSYKWLHKDLFQFFGMKVKEQELNYTFLCMLKQQRRFHKSICDLISLPFYNGQLITSTETKTLKLYKKSPHKDKVIIYNNLSSYPDFKCLRTKEKSRINHGSASFVIENILKELLKHELKYPFSIAILSPYNGQINLYKQLLPQSIKDNDFLSRVKLGTIHAFQGSEADLVIFDLVDSKEVKIGKLYWENSGERLLNVAISRATGKLIFVGDISAINEGIGYMNVSNKVKLLLKEIEKNQV
jgi:superfamily I DNA and/or RNA helicase